MDKKKGLLNLFYEELKVKGITKKVVFKNLNELTAIYGEVSVNECLADELIKRITLGPAPYIQITEKGLDYIK